MSITEVLWLHGKITAIIIKFNTYLSINIKADLIIHLYGLKLLIKFTWGTPWEIQISDENSYFKKLFLIYLFTKWVIWAKRVGFFALAGNHISLTDPLQL